MEHEDGPFAETMNALPNYVASRTLTELKWTAKPIEGDVTPMRASLASHLRRYPGCVRRFGLPNEDAT